MTDPIKNNGITLISLVITIVIMLILAGVGIYGSLALIEEAKYSAFINEMKQLDESVAILILEKQIESAETGEEIKLFKDLADISLLPESVQNEIKYIRAKLAGNANENEIPLDYEGTTLSNEGIYYVDAETAGGKEQAYIYDEQSASVYKIEPTIIWGVEMHGYEYGNLLVTQSGLLERAQNKEKNPPKVGQEVALKDGWGTQTVEYISTSDGTIVKDVDLVATVYAVSVGEEETVPVPKGFYYVGGNLNTGVIISDESDDRYGYNPETKEENDTELDKTAHSYNTQLKGNQFVWIPCTEEEYVKTTWGKLTNGNNSWNAEWETTVEASELTQIQKYGGFYVARYEAGLATTIEEFTENQTYKTGGTIQVYNKIEGKPQSRAGQVPWNFIDWTWAKKNAESMYNNDYVHSGLITGTQWDVMLNKIVEKTELETADMTNSEDWGNYKDTSIAYEGRLAKATYASSTGWTLVPFGEKITGTTTDYGTSNAGDLLTTGASSVTEKYHIYDVAGNVWEWTEEDSHYAETGQYRVVRGGGYVDAYATYPACYRHGHNPVGHTGLKLGFRPVLYMK